LVTVKDVSVERIDKDSEPIWRRSARVHHDLWVNGNEVWMLTRAPRLVPLVHAKSPTLVDSITVLDLDTGEFIREIDLLEVLLNSPFRGLLPNVALSELGGGAEIDIIHTNHVEVFDGDLEHLSPLFRAGNMLISMRQTSAVAILNPDKLSIEWLWGPSNVVFKHHPTLTREGTILLFDNGLKQSRVVEVDPRNNQIVWQYTDSKFFSELRGSVQRLPNGNTLVTESDTGHVLEVTVDGERVWEFATPHFDSRANGRRYGERCVTRKNNCLSCSRPREA